MTDQTRQTVILRDQQGTVYAIPHATLEAGGASADQLPALQQAAGDEVAGYLFGPTVQNDFLPPGGHAIGAPSPSFVGGLVGLAGPVALTVQNEATPH